MANRNLDDLTVAYLLKKVTDSVNSAWQAAVSTINATIASIQTALNGKVSKAGDTMDGSLTIASSTDPVLALQNPDYEIGDSSLQGNSMSALRFTDKNGTTYSLGRAFLMQNGATRFNFAAVRPVGNSTVQNGFYVQIASDGTRAVGFDDAAVWRNALGLGTDGAFPITIDQGGTGMTGTAADITTASQIATAGANFAITSAHYRSWGKLAMVNILLKCTTAVTSTSGTTLFTLVSGKKPVLEYNTVDNAGNRIYFNTGGACSTYRTFAVDATVAVRTCYLLA